MSADSHVTRQGVVVLAAAILLACAVHAFFLNKPFTTDDPVFMRQAELALRDPGHPTLADIVWTDVPQPPGSVSGPVIAWLLAPAAWAGGYEAAVHLIQLFGLVLAIVSTVLLARRMGLSLTQAGSAGLLLASTPTALAMVGTATPDVWAMALGVLGIERGMTWRVERRWHQGLLAALFLALGALTRSHVILLAAIGALFMVRDPWVGHDWLKSDRGRWLPFIAVPILVALGLWLTNDPSRRSPGLVGVTSSLTTLDALPGNLVAFATHWVFALPLVLPLAILRWRQLLSRWWLLVFGPASLVVLLFLSPWTRPDLWFLAVPIGGLTVAILWDILATGWSSRRWDTVVLGLWLLVPLAVVPYHHLPSKYLLVSAPAAAILVARQLARIEWPRARWVLGSTCAAGLLLGVAILRADQRFGELGRHAAATIIAPRVAAGQQVWFGGHWGFQWYAERAGARILTLTPPYPRRGDLIVVSHSSELTPGIIDLLQRIPGLVGIGHLEDRTPGGRIMSEGAGFYSNGWGLLPWVWGDGPLDTIDVMQVE